MKGSVLHCLRVLGFLLGTTSIVSVSAEADLDKVYLRTPKGRLSIDRGSNKRFFIIIIISR